MTLPQWQRIAEERIQQAIEAGAFEDLPGAGQPLELEENPFEGAWQPAYRLLKNADMAPRWIELDLEVRRETERLRCELRRVHQRHGTDGLLWERALERFQEQVERLNAKVHLRNHLAPNSVVPRFPLRPGRELRRVTSDSG